MIKFTESYVYKEWKKCLYLSNDSIELLVPLEIGPRIMRFGFCGGQNLFGENDEQTGKTRGKEWRIYGGTRLWHAPESIPRSYYPDNDSIEYEWNNNTLNLLQKIESTTRLQKEIIIKMDPNCDMISLKYRIHNRNLWDIKYAPWVLSVMNVGGKAIIPQEPYKSQYEKLTPARPLVLWPYTNMEDPRWKWGKKYIQLSHDKNSDSPQKLGLINKTSWIAYNLGENLFIKRYGFEKEASYVDYGVNTEIYTDSNILELETLGKYENILAGDYAEQKENWYIFRAKIDESEESIDNIVLPMLNKTKLP